MNDKIQIIIASVLKPVDDTRSYEKMAQSLVQTSKYEVNIIGFESKKIPIEPNIHFHPIFNKERNDKTRLLLPLKVWKKYIQLKPKLIIVNSPELLLVTILYKIIFGGKMIYDITENYRWNVQYNQVYKFWQKPILKFYLWLSEWLSSLFVEQFFLAEKVYAEQLKFIYKKPFKVLENKTLIKTEGNYPIELKDKDQLHFVISGTLGEEYGTLEGISFFLEFQKHFPKSDLTVIGFSADQSYRKKIEQFCENRPAITLESGNKPVNQEYIIMALKKADLAILPYKINKNLQFRIPTKFYDCIACHTVMIIPNNPAWIAFLSSYNAAYGIDFTQQIPANVFEQIISSSFFGLTDSKDISWKTEEDRLINSVFSLFK